MQLMSAGVGMTRDRFALAAALSYTL